MAGGEAGAQDAQELANGRAVIGIEHGDLTSAVTTTLLVDVASRP